MGRVKQGPSCSSPELLSCSPKAGCVLHLGVLQNQKSFSGRKWSWVHPKAYMGRETTAILSVHLSLYLSSALHVSPSTFCKAHRIWSSAAKKNQPIIQQDWIWIGWLFRYWDICGKKSIWSIPENEKKIAMLQDFSKTVFLDYTDFYKPTVCLHLSSLKLLMLATFTDRRVVWWPSRLIYCAIPANILAWCLSWQTGPSGHLELILS